MWEQIQSELDELRNNLKGLSQYQFEPMTPDQSLSRCHNALKRRRLAYALQYSVNEHACDGELLRGLLKAEIEATKRGLGYSYSLIVFATMLSLHRKVEDTWVLLEAKSINFDTHNELSSYLLITGGVEATKDFVKQSSHPDKEHWFKTQAYASETDLKNWLNNRKQEYKIDFDSLSANQKVRIALELREYKQALEYLKLWKKSVSQWDEPERSNFEYYEGQVKKGLEDQS